MYAVQIKEIEWYRLQAQREADISTTLWECSGMFWYYTLSTRFVISTVGSCSWGIQKYIVLVALVSSNRLRSPFASSMCLALAA